MKRISAEKAGKRKTGNVEQQIRRIHDAGRVAALKGDAAYLEKYLADDYLGIGGTTGETVTKQEVIQRRKSGAMQYDSIHERDVKVRVYGDAAIVNYITSVKAISDGTPVTGDFRGTWVYVKQDGQWKLVSGQWTPITAEKT